jgi:hypothetical protein
LRWCTSLGKAGLYCITAVASSLNMIRLAKTDI